MNIYLIIISINIIVYFFSYNNQNILVEYGLNYYFTQGFYYQAISNVFLHGSIEHLLMNMVALYQCGIVLKNDLNWKIFLLLYFLGAIVISTLSLYFSLYVLKDIVNMIGASGVISMFFAIMGYLHKEYLKGIFVAILLMSFAPLLFGINIAWYAHLIGFAFGIFVVFLLRRINAL